MLKIIIIPFAGDLGYCSNEWKEYFSNEIDLKNIIYPGRGVSLKEDYAKEWEELLDDVYEQIIKEIDNCDYAIFGHSMGGVVLHDIYYKLMENKKKEPKFIVFSGTDVPSFRNEKLSELSEEEFKQYFVQLGGVSKEVLEDKEMCEYVFEVLRSDIILIDQYNYSDNGKTIKCPVIVMNGKDDKINSKKNEWESFLNKPCKYLELEGGHFYLFEHKRDFVKAIEDILDEYR